MSRRVGILGGGQLAQMLAQEAPRLQLVPVVYTDHPNEGAAKATSQFVVGKLNDAGALSKFFSQVDFVIFENEFVPADLLRKVSQGKVKFYPSLDTLEALRDKLSQKQTLQKLGIPSAPFLACEKKDSVKDWLGEVRKQFPSGCILKWGGMGYDGKGVYRFHANGELATAEAFCQKSKEMGVSLYAEAWVKYRRELAIISSRTLSGVMTSYPIVVSEQWESICDTVTGPASQLGLDAKKQKVVEGFASKLAESTQLCGTFALELFELESGEIWVNEVAPRVHNSGHFSQDSGGASQFENHLRAVMDMPLGSTEPKAPFAMVNLLGPDGVMVKSSEVQFPPLPAGVHLHWYDKEEIRGRRKVGHVNGIAEGKEPLISVVDKLRQYRQNWVEQVKKAAGKDE